MISENIIQSIIDRAAIVDVIGEFVSLKNRGANYLGLCPFHDEKTPSFTVSKAKGIYKCFGCGAGGNVIKFIQELEKLSYPEALRYLAKKYQIEIPEVRQTAEEIAKNSKRENLLLVNKFAQNYFSHMLVSNKASSDKAGWTYLTKKRKFTPEIIEKFQLGYCIDQPNSFTSTATQKGYLETYLIELGLTGKKHSAYDRFRNRVMFPFHSLTGQLIGFTGRIIPSIKDLVDDSDKKQAKYINSKDSELFQKGKILYGLYQAKQAIIKQKSANLVEGNTDVVSWHQSGIENTVCTSGTALTIDQIRLLHRFTEVITIIFDNDPAGIKAALKGVDLILSEGMNVNVVVLPEGEDPDSFAQNKQQAEILGYIEEHSKDFLLFKISILAEDLMDPQNTAEAIHSIAASISVIPDEIQRNVYMRRVTDLMKIDETVLAKSIKKNLPEANLQSAEFFAFSEASEPIKENNVCQLFKDNNEVIEAHTNGKENTIGYTNLIGQDAINKLKKLTKNITICDKIYRVYDEAGNEVIEISFAKKLLKEGFNVNYFINDDQYKKYQETEIVSFIDIYSDVIYIHATSYNKIESKKALEEFAEAFAMYDNTTIIKNAPVFAKRFGMNTSELKQILKPFLEKKKSLSAFEQEDIVVDGTQYSFALDNLPDYVDERFFRRYGYFPAQNKKNEKIFYVFKTQDGGLQKIGNFYLEPLFQVHDPDPNLNKRIVKIRHAEINMEDYLELPSGAMIEFAQFKKLLWNEGGYVFSKGKPFHHDIILESIALDFPKCFELKIFGQQPENFYAFTNAVFADGEIIYMDELGLVKWDNKTYYSPSVSLIHTKHRADSDKYANDRYFVYKKENKTTFLEWADLVDEVFKYNRNGMWAITYTILSAYRSIIYPIDKMFTSLFFIGPTESGKSKIAESVAAPFMHGAPLFNLNSGTDAAFFTTLERYRDVPVIYEEYNDYQISDIKFQGLKAAVYDGEGKTKRKDASSKELDISQVNCAPVLLGQEAPERDDGSLGNRCVICHVPKKDDWSDEEVKLFQDLKNREKEGLSNIVLEILKKRPIVQKYYQKTLRDVTKQFKEDLQKSGSIYQTRILNTVSLFLTMIKLYEEKCPDLQLPFSFAEFYSEARKKVITQSEAILQTNRIAVFFDTLELLLNDEKFGIRNGKEFKIEETYKLTVQINRKETEEINYSDGPIKVIFLRLNILHPMYLKLRGNEGLKYNALQTYMKDHPGYIGMVKSSRFRWDQEIRKANENGFVESKIETIEKNTSAIAFNYEILKQDGIDLEKALISFSRNPIAGNSEEQNINKESIPDATQLEFEEKPF